MARPWHNDSEQQIKGEPWQQTATAGRWQNGDETMEWQATTDRPWHKRRQRLRA